MLAIQTHHLLVFQLLFQRLVTCTHFFFARVLCDAFQLKIVLAIGVHMLVDKYQSMVLARKRDGLVAGEDLMPSVSLVPLGQGGRYMHLFDDVSPTHARVIRA